MKLSSEKKLYYAKKVTKRWAKHDAERDAPIPEPLNVIQLRNLPYADAKNEEDARFYLTDIYYPQLPCERFPVIVNIHGGGWFYGDKETYGTYTKYLASKGFAVVNYNYRLAPVHTYPAAFEDTCRVLAFLAANAEKLHLDAERIFLIGDSAGAQLAAQYGIFVTSEAYRKLLPELCGIPRVIPRKIVLNCGLFQIDETRRGFSSDWYMPEEPTAEHAESAFHMLDYVGVDFPQTFLMASVNDGLMPESQRMKGILETQNVPFVYREYGQNDKHDSHVFHLNLRSAEAIRCNEEELQFLSATDMPRQTLK